MDQLYYESGYIVDGYYTYVAEAASDNITTSAITITPRVIRNTSAELSMSTDMIVTAGATSRLTIVPGVYSSTAGKTTFGAFYIDAGPQVIV